MQVLVVDDEVAIVELLAELLMDEGYQVHTAYDGRSALTVLQSEPYVAVVISDIMMPGIDGWALYHALRADPNRSSTGIVLMSAGHVPPADLHDERAIFIGKPFSVADILNAIEHVSP